MDDAQICLIGVQFGAGQITGAKTPSITDTISARYSVDYLKDIMNALDKSGARFATLTLKQDVPIQISATIEGYEDASETGEATVNYWLAPNIGEDKTEPIPFKTTPASAPDNAPSEDAGTPAPRDAENAGQATTAPDVV
jgi:hypothetical protein